jgi:hypothetical protein
MACFTWPRALQLHVHRRTTEVLKRPTQGFFCHTIGDDLIAIVVDVQNRDIDIARIRKWGQQFAGRHGRALAVGRVQRMHLSAAYAAS